MFERAPGISTMDKITENEDKESNEENSESKPIEDILEEIIEEEAIDENPPEGFLISYESDINDPNSDTDEDSIGSTK